MSTPFDAHKEAEAMLHPWKMGLRMQQFDVADLAPILELAYAAGLAARDAGLNARRTVLREVLDDLEDDQTNETWSIGLCAARDRVRELLNDTPEIAAPSQPPAPVARPDAEAARVGQLGVLTTCPATNGDYTCGRTPRCVKWCGIMLDRNRAAAMASPMIYGVSSTATSSPRTWPAARPDGAPVTCLRPGCVRETRVSEPGNLLAMDVWCLRCIESTQTTAFDWNADAAAWRAHREAAATPVAETPTFEKLVEKVGPLPMTGLATAETPRLLNPCAACRHPPHARTCDYPRAPGEPCGCEAPAETPRVPPGAGDVWRDEGGEFTVIREATSACMWVRWKDHGEGSIACAWFEYNKANFVRRGAAVEAGAQASAAPPLERTTGDARERAHALLGHLGSKHGPLGCSHAEDMVTGALEAADAREAELLHWAREECAKADALRAQLATAEKAADERHARLVEVADKLAATRSDVEDLKAQLAARGPDSRDARLLERAAMLLAVTRSMFSDEPDCNDLAPVNAKTYQAAVRAVLAEYRARSTGGGT